MEAPTPQESRKRISLWLVASGIVFIILWLAGAFVLGTMKLMASLMANDSGAASGEEHETLIFGMMGGQLLTGLAGIPAGLAFFWRGWRKRLLWTFLIMLIIGILIQAAAFCNFFPS